MHLSHRSRPHRNELKTSSLESFGRTPRLGKRQSSALQCDRGASAPKAACEDEPPASANSRARTWLSSTALKRPRSHQKAPPTRMNGMTVINAVINSKAMRVSSSLPVMQTEHAAAIPGVNRTPHAISSHTMREDRFLIVGTPRGKARAILPRQRTRTLLPRQTSWA